eukprot:14621560-Ditylum_brightwellii.AAC.1
MTLKQILQTTEEIWIVTDGGVNKEYGYYGFVIAMDTTILWKGNGQAYGNPQQMESQQAESVGGLA